jgi:hypothetical protein
MWYFLFPGILLIQNCEGVIEYGVFLSEAKIILDKVYFKNDVKKFEGMSFVTHCINQLWDSSL